MAVDQGFVEYLDAQLSQLLAGWNTYTTIIVTVLCLFVVYPWLIRRDPDIHPLFLARQSSVSYVRQPGYSAVYRSLEVPQQYPLRSGLNVKDPQAPKWSGGKDGDLRDVWKQALKGPVNENGESAGTGKIITILGTEIKERTLEDVSGELKGIGNHIKSQNGKRVAVYLTNSVEMLMTIFAGAFYGFDVIVIPFERNKPRPVAESHLMTSILLAKPDILITEAGSVDLAHILESYKGLDEIVWVAKSASRHMHWSEKPESIKDKIHISAWHDLIEEVDHIPEFPEEDGSLSNLEMFWPSTDSEAGRLVVYSQKNLVAAIAALVFNLPRNQRLGPTDILLPIDSLAYSYPLLLTMAALFSNSSVALNSVAGADVDFEVAVRPLNPTVVVASEASILPLHKDLKPQNSNLTSKLQRYVQQRSMDAGSMPDSTILSALIPADAAVVEATSTLRLLFISRRVFPSMPSTPPLDFEVLSDLRAALNTRIVYALTAGDVAGAVAQTHCYDYRRPLVEHRVSFGPPLSCVEVLLKDRDEWQTVEGEDPKGEIIVRGPAVVGGESATGIIGTFGEDCTLAQVMA